MVLSNAQWFANPGEAYTIDQSCRFNDDDSAYLYRTPGSSGNRRTWTFSTWFKKSGATGGALLGAGEDASVNDNYIFIGWHSFSGGLNVQCYNTPESFQVATSAFYRDIAAWYHVVVAFDTTQSTAANRVKIYINGSQVTDLATTTYPTQNEEFQINHTEENQVCRSYESGGYFFDGYMAETYLIDGTALTPSSFGETNSTTGQWVPIEVADLTYGTNGFRFSYEDSSALGDDTSGEGNDYTSSGLASTDQMTDTPTDNFATWNSIAATVNAATLSDGNLTALRSSGNTDIESSTIAVLASGNWYAEFTIDATGSGSHIWSVGVIKSDDAELYDTGEPRLGDGAEGYAYTTNWSASPVPHKANNGTKTSYGSAGSAADIIGVHLSSGALTFYHNNSTQGEAFSGLSGDFLFGWSGQTGSKVTANYGQRSFAYTPPTGAVGISTANLSNPTTADPTAYFQTTIYTGTGSSLAVNQGGNSTFEPDFVWIKNRDATDSHILTDSVRGATKVINSNTTDAETTDADTLTSFDSDGFTVGADAKVNTNTEKYVSWQWIEGATPGFDVVSFTGNATNRTISHSLSAVPEFMLVKNLADTDNWAAYHASNTAAPATDYLILNSNAATADDATIWNDTAPTSSVFSVGTSSLTNGNTEAMIAYLWAGVEGFSQFGTFTGNGNAGGPFIYCGFRPNFIIQKRSNSSGAWYLHDIGRNTYNVALISSRADDNAVEGSHVNRSMDILSNGFKLRGTDAGQEYNIDGGIYIFAAFAETPFKTANAR